MGVARGRKETYYPKCLVELGLQLKAGFLSGSVEPCIKAVPRPWERICLAVPVAVKPGEDEDHQEKCLSQLYSHMPEGLTPLATLKNVHQRQQLGACWLCCSLPLCPVWPIQPLPLTDNPRRVARAGPEEKVFRVIVATLDSETRGHSPLASAGVQSCVCMGSVCAQPSHRGARALAVFQLPSGQGMALGHPILEAHIS